MNKTLQISLAVSLVFLGQDAYSASATLGWTATGDDGNVGRATAYDLRYSTDMIYVHNWAFATKVTGLSTPKSAGSVESVEVNELEPETLYYFAIKTVDESMNWSMLSNVAVVTSSAGACCALRGDINHSNAIDIADLVFLVDYMFLGGPEPPCMLEADVNGSEGPLDMSDLVYFVEYCFSGSAEPVPCSQDLTEQ